MPKTKKRNKNLSFSLSAEEREHIRRMAHSRDMSVSAYIRRILKQNPVEANK